MTYPFGVCAPSQRLRNKNWVNVQLFSHTCSLSRILLLLTEWETWPVNPPLALHPIHPIQHKWSVSPAQQPLSSLPFPSLPLSLASAFPFSSQGELEGGRLGESSQSGGKAARQPARARDGVRAASQRRRSASYNSVWVYEGRKIVKSWIAYQEQIRAQMRNRLKVVSN